MKLFISLVALVSFVAGDVSHITNAYLPPHSVSSQSRTVTFTPSSGYSSGLSGAYTSSNFPSSSITHGSSYSGKLQSAVAPAQSYNFGSSGSASSPYTAQKPNEGKSATNSYSSGSVFSSAGKQVVEKTYSAPLIQPQNFPKTFSAAVVQKPQQFSEYSAGGSSSGYSTSGFPSTSISSGFSGKLQGAATPTQLFRSDSSGGVSSPFTVQGLTQGHSITTNYNGGSGLSSSGKQIVQNTYSSPIGQQQIFQKTYSAPVVQKSYTSPVQQLVQQSYTAPGKSFTSYESYKSPAVQKATYSLPIEQRTYSTGAVVKESFTAPVVQQTFTGLDKIDKNYNLHGLTNIQKTIVSAPLVEQRTYTLPAAPQTFPSSGKSYNSYQAYTSPGTQHAIASAPLVQKTLTSKTTKQSYTAPSVERGYLAPAIQQAYTASIGQKASYTAPGKISYTNYQSASSPKLESTTYTSAAIKQPYTALGKTYNYQTVTSPILQQTTAQKTVYPGSTFQQSYTTPSKAYTNYQSVSSPAVQKAYTDAQKISYASPITQQSYTAPGKSYNNYQSVSAPTTQKVSFNEPLVQQQSYTAPGKTYNSYQSSLPASPVQQPYTSSAVQKINSYTAPAVQKTTSYTIPIAQQSYTSPGKSYNSYQSYTAPIVQKSYSAPAAVEHLKSVPASTASYKAQSVESFSGPSHSSVIASAGIDTKYATNGGYIY